jgi:hypothetical protein
LSSILKALKKLENQAADQNHVRFQRPKNHMQNIVGHEQINGHLRLKKRHVIIFTGLVFAVGSGLILSQKLYEKMPEFITKKETVLEQPARLPEKKATMPPDRIQKESSSRKNVKKIEPIAKAAPPPAHKSPKDTSVLFNKKTSPPEQARKDTVAEKSEEKSAQDTNIDRFASIPVKQPNQTKIELQAIAWSKDPKSRLAVINGLILRERESIDNVIVMHIGKDEVIFKKGGEEWKQIFGF